MKSSQLHPSNRSEYQEYEGKKLVLSTNHYFGCFKSFLKPRKVKGSLFIFSLNIHDTTFRFSDFTLRISSITITKHAYPCLMSNHCQPPKYSCNRYCCGDEKGNYDCDDPDYDDDGDGDGDGDCADDHAMAISHW